MISINRFPKSLDLCCYGKEIKTVTINSQKQYYSLVKLLNKHGSNIQIYESVPSFINSPTKEKYNEILSFFSEFYSSRKDITT